MSELNILLMRRRKIHWGEKQTETQVYCLPCAGAAAGAGHNKFCSENSHPSHDIELAALENESLDKKCSDNIAVIRELACEISAPSTD